MTRWWLSWVSPVEDYRPVAFPPANHDVIGWWCTGYDADDRAILCALVRADSEWAAKDRILGDWPETHGIDWRFCEERPADWLPGDRFPLKGWMRKRAGLTRGRREDV